MNLSFPEFVLIWQRHQGAKTPVLHRRLARWFDSKVSAGDRRLLLLAFRNSGKSTMLGLFAAWLLCKQPEHRILVLAAEHALATKLSRFARRVVERHPLCAHLRSKGEATSWADDSFTVARTGTWRDPSLLARGIGGNITGAHADTVICDDVEVPNTTGTAQRREWLRDRLREVEHILSPEGLQIYAGTPHSFYSIYAQEARPEIGEEAPFLAGFRRCVLPVIDGEGASAWPERFSTDAIAAMRKRVGPNVFASQMLLQPKRPEAARFDAAMLNRYSDDIQLVERNGQFTLSIGNTKMVAASAWWDPAYGFRKTGDGSTVAVVFVDESGTYWLHRLAYLKVDESLELDPASQQCRKVGAILAELHLPSINLESNGIGRFLPGLLRRELADQRIGASVVSVSSKISKNDRILAALDAPLAANMIRAHDSIWQTRLIEELAEWRPGSRGHDDGLDAVSGAISATTVRLPRNPIGITKSWRGQQIVKAPTDFRV